MATAKPASTLIFARAPLVDSSGTATFAALKIFQQWDTKLNNGLNLIGQITQPIPPTTPIDGRTEGLGTTVQNINSAGVVLPSGIPAATTTTQGAVVLPIGAASNQLGTAALQASTAFDPSGAASTAQSNAETFATSAANTAQANAQTFATTAANTAQANAQTFASNASNLSSGTVSAARLPANVAVVSFGSGAPVGSSTEGYLYFDTSVSPYQGYVFHSAAWNKFS